MTGGYVGKSLWVDLAKGELKEEVLDEKLCREFIGGYGIGARLIFSRQKAGVDPLGPDNIFGIVTGPLTGTPTLSGSRYTIVGKSPLTGTWGDANSGGDFGPGLKFAGYDAVFFTGIAEKPVYLFIEEGRPYLKDAAHLWGKDTNDTDDIIRGELGEKVKVLAIGPSGENLSLIACPINNKGRAPGRSGFGAVMGSKRLKAVAVSGNMEIPLADKKGADEARSKYLKELNEPLSNLFRDYGTPGVTVDMGGNGDSPVKNWGGVGITDFPDITPIGGDNVIARQRRPYACWHCPLGCGGIMKAGEEYSYAEGTHKPEYETLAAFGTMCLNNNVESVIKANDICNRYGLDTISTGCTVAFAIECYENGLITKEDTGGIELTWGNHAAIIDITEQLAKRQGFGAILADGVKVAAERIGKGSEKYAVHIQGQEVPMHDPKYAYSLAPTYKLDPTPARHMQGSGFADSGLPMPTFDQKSFSGRGEAHKIGSNFTHIANCAGMCLFMYMCIPAAEAIVEFMRNVTGWDVTLDELLKTGERIANLRQAFNIREGLNPIEFKVPDRVLGRPAQTEGPLAGVTIDEDTMEKEYMAALDWDAKTAKPSKKKLLELGLDDVALELWP
ncbi:aldehyde ferredoxin oxidoreductase family protein [Chloroflexota bacterium]